MWMLYQSLPLRSLIIERGSSERSSPVQLYFWRRFFPKSILWITHDVVPNATPIRSLCQGCDNLVAAGRRYTSAMVEVYLMLEKVVFDQTFLSNWIESEHEYLKTISIRICNETIHYIQREEKTFTPTAGNVQRQWLIIGVPISLLSVMGWVRIKLYLYLHCFRSDFSVSYIVIKVSN